MPPLPILIIAGIALLLIAKPDILGQSTPSPPSETPFRNPNPIFSGVKTRRNNAGSGVNVGYIQKKARLTNPTSNILGTIGSVAKLLNSMNKNAPSGPRFSGGRPSGMPKLGGGPMGGGGGGGGGGKGTSINFNFGDNPEGDAPTTDSNNPDDANPVDPSQTNDQADDNGQTGDSSYMDTGDPSDGTSDAIDYGDAPGGGDGEDFQSLSEDAYDPSQVDQGDGS